MISAQSEDTGATAGQHHRQAPLEVPILARTIVVTVICGFGVTAVLHVLYLRQGWGHVTLSVAYMIVLVLLQLFYFSNRPPAQLRTPLGYLALLTQACLVYLPLLQFRDAWVGLSSFLAGTAPLVLPPAAGWLTFGLVVVGMAAVQVALTGSPLDIAYTTLATMIVGLSVYGLSRLASLVTELHKARTELAQMAVAQERLRFARDLHDLLGYSLSAITLKSELTHRLVTKQPARARAELSEILEISRRALSDVRSVASGYRELSLDAESESVRSVLVAADIDVRMALDYGRLPDRVRTVLATVLREGVINVLRHSKAERCEITVRQVDGNAWIDIVNDGALDVRTERATQGGSGIPNLSARVVALGGTLTAGRDADGRFRLHASVPVCRGRAKSRGGREPG